jgi:hypothetical protein
MSSQNKHRESREPVQWQISGGTGLLPPPRLWLIANEKLRSPLPRNLLEIVVIPKRIWVDGFPTDENEDGQDVILDAAIETPNVSDIPFAADRAVEPAQQKICDPPALAGISLGDGYEAFESLSLSCVHRPPPI